VGRNRKIINEAALVAHDSEQLTPMDYLCSAVISGLRRNCMPISINGRWPMNRLVG